MDLNRQEYNINHKETRRHYSLDACQFEGADFAVEDEALDALFAEPTAAERLHTAIAKLKPEQQKLIRAIYFEGVSVNDYTCTAKGNKGRSLWQCIDGAAYLPQSRKRVFLVGYSDPRCAGEILPVERKSGKALSELTDHQPQGKRVYDATGTAITQSVSCGGFGGRTGLYLVDYNENS
ncbi:MAG TPA: hypothetical protein DEQ85_10110, partial [Clostridiales bacterium]|nr:hypothetical protein [Clostridiales bacterium]